MTSRRTIPSESLNGENLKGQWLSMGVNLISVTGDEYDNIMPMWDWAALPGVTSPYNPAEVSPPGGRSDTSFVGAASNGVYGVAAMDFDYADPVDPSRHTRARKAMFFFDREIVALGAGIDSDDFTHPIRTTINQCRLRGEVTVDGGVINQGNSLLRAYVVHHDQIGYVFPNSAPIDLAKRFGVIGSWSAINSQYSPDDNKIGDVFSLALDHGLKPRSASYAYLIVPDISAEQLRDYADDLPVRILVNLREQQAVRNDGLGITGIVYYTPGSVVLRSGLALTVDQPCIVLLDESPSARDPRLTVANPQQDAIAVTIGFEYDHGNRRKLTLHLPAGAKAGNSVTTVLLPRLYPPKHRER